MARASPARACPPFFIAPWDKFSSSLFFGHDLCLKCLVKIDKMLVHHFRPDAQMFQSLSTISPTNTRLRCVLSFHDQCLKPHRPLYLVLPFQPLDPPFLLEPKSAWGSSLLFCRLQWPGCLDELQVMQIAGSRCSCSPVIGLPNRPLSVTVSAMCFANVSGSGHHISPLSSHMRCGICQPHRQGRHFQPKPQDHAQGGILLGLLKHQSASDLCFGLQVEDGW